MSRNEPLSNTRSLTMHEDPQIEPPREARGRRARRAAPGLAALAAAVVVGGAVVAVIEASRGGSSSPAPAAAPSTASAPGTGSVVSSTSVVVGAGTIARIYRERSPGVVDITSTITSNSSSPFGGSQTETASGTGFVLDRQGDILTNDHVISGARSIHVSFADGTDTTGTIVGTDPSTDLAIVKVNVPSSKLQPLPLGSSSTLPVGSWVVAIGDPFGYDRSITAGIVSGVGRTIEAPNGFTIDNAIQTDAAINHGNSGGPLLDMNGRVVGITAQIADSGVNANVGVGFAVPIDTAKRVIPDLESGTTIARGWLGVQAQTVDQALAATTGVGAKSGALVTGITSGSPAASAGLKGGSHVASVDSLAVCVGGDVITAVDGKPIASVADLQNAISERAPGDTVKLSVTHANGTTGTVSVTLAKRPASAPTNVQSACGS
jgi:S1-C subfamily serine protease